jgi:hypothetical protein
MMERRSEERWSGNKTTRTIMKRNSTLILSTLLAGAVAVGALAQGRRAAAPALTETAEKALREALAGPDGEYAARAEYEAILDQFGATVQPYANILRAEERHIAALERQCVKYGVAIPTDEYLGKIMAPSDLKQAAEAGVLAEKANVAMYDRLLQEVEAYPDLVRVFTNLRAASLNNHLPAFEAAAANDGQVPAAFCNGTGCRRQGQGAGGPRWGAACPADCPACPGPGQGRGQGRGPGQGQRQFRGGR